VASKNRGGQPVDDEFPEDEPVDEFDDEDSHDDLEDEDDEFDEESDDDLEDEDDEDDELEDEAPVGRGRVATSRAAASARTTTKAGARTRAAAKARRDADLRPGLIGRFINFVREVVAELQKVIWPTRKELLTYTTVVVVFVAIMMSFVALLDYGFARAMFAVFGSKTTQ
jgi:preprotein translocase subunit SecE